MKNIITCAIVLLQINTVWGAAYDTLPKGISTAVAKQVKASKIEARYGANSQSSGLKVKQEFNSSNLQNINSAIDTYFQELKAISPDAYNQFSLGEFRANAYVDVNVQGVGFGHGITDHLTLFGSLPVYHIKSHIDFVQTKKSNLLAVRNTINSTNTTSATGNFIKDLTNQLPETNEQLLQSLVVNFFGYKPLGHLERDAAGDAEVGVIYRLTDLSDKGQAISVGAFLPTGKIDDPDSLQDVATGDGQYDLYLESLSGISFLDNSLQFDLSLRYTHQFGASKKLRLISNADVPLAKDSRTIYEKLGNKYDATITAKINPTVWLNVNTSLIMNKVASTTYDVPEADIKSAMEARTDSYSNWGRIGIGFSGVELYKRKKLDVPFEVNLSYQRILSAKNSPDFERVDVEMRLYF